MEVVGGLITERRFCVGRAIFGGEDISTMDPRTGRSSICLALELAYFFCFVLEGRNGAWIESKFGSLLPRIVRLNHTTGDALEKLLGVCKSTLLSAINVAL